MDLRTFSIDLGNRVESLVRDTPEPLRGAPGAATVVLALALCVYAPWMARNAVRATMPVRGGESSAPPVTATAGTPEALLQNLVGAHLFGQSPMDQATSTPAQDLLLTGVVASTDPQKGLAFIGRSTDSVRLFRVGETEDDIRLVAVYGAHVLFERGGVLQSLEMPKEFSFEAYATTQVAAVPARAGVPPNSAVFGAIINAHLRSSDEGKQVGYLVYPGENHEAFNLLGLRGGDVILSVNGQQLDNPESSTQILGELSLLQNAQVTVKRGRSEWNLSLDIAGTLESAARRRAEVAEMEAWVEAEAEAKARARANRS